MEYLSKARIYRAIKDTPINEEEQDYTINKITKVMLEICDRRYVSKYIDNSKHLIHTYTNRNFDVLPITDLAKYIDNQLNNTQLQSIQNLINVLHENYLSLERRIKALEEKVNNFKKDE